MYINNYMGYLFMKYNFKSNNGSILILVSILLPILISAVGICIDGVLVSYYQTRLMVATKLAAVSATSYYTLEGDSIKINVTNDKVKELLTTNFKDAKLKKLTIDSKNKCTVESEVDVNFVFMKIFGINSKTLFERYTATRG